MGLLCGGYAIVASYWSLRNHWGFLTYGFDISIFDQGVWLLSRFREPFVTVRGLNLFGDHTSFILIFLVPLYWIFNSAAVLLVAQATAMAVGGIAVFLIAREKLRNEFMATAFTLVYLLHPALGWTNLENFHPDSFEVPLALFAFFFMIKERWRPFLVTVVLLLMVKEDVALLTIPLGIYVALVHHRVVGAVTAVTSLLWLVLVLRVVIPALNEAGSMYEARLAFGGIGGTMSALFTQPLDVVRLFFSESKPGYLLQLFAPVAALPLLGWRLGLLAVAPLAGNLLSTFPYQHRIEYHYTTLIIPVLVVAAIYGASKVWSMRARMLLTGAAAIAVLISAYVWGPAPFSRHPGPLGDPAGQFAIDAREVVGRIPRDAEVSAIPQMVPHLTQRSRIFEYPNPWIASNWGDFSSNGERLPYADTVEYIVLYAEPDPEFIESLGNDFSVALSNSSLMVLERVP